MPSRAPVNASFVIVLKSAVGFSVAALVLVGALGPALGLEPTGAVEGAAAIAGALAGGLLALQG